MRLAAFIASSLCETRIIAAGLGGRFAREYPSAPQRAAVLVPDFAAAQSGLRLLTMIQKLVNIGVITVTSLIAILLSLIVLGISVPPLIWLLSFIDTAPEQNDCAIGSVDRQQFERLLREAKRHDWTVWPGLSNGILEPSDRGIKQPWPHLRRRQGEKLLDQIKELVP